jgi:hypothetical protein
MHKETFADTIKPQVPEMTKVIVVVGCAVVKSPNQGTDTVSTVRPPTRQPPDARKLAIPAENVFFPFSRQEE